jgi:polysaccharide export outer membrane protein
MAIMLVTASCAGHSQSTSYAAQPAGDTGYRLGVGDKIRVSVYGEDKLTGDYILDDKGQVSFPLIGNISALDLTPEEFRVALTNALSAGYLRNPSISVAVAEFRPFYIMGEVERPGRYPTETGMTLDRAIATAGGYTYRANKKFVFIKHENQSEEVKAPTASEIKIRPGDVVRVGERYF